MSCLSTERGPRANIKIRLTRSDAKGSEAELAAAGRTTLTHLAVENGFVGGHHSQLSAVVGKRLAFCNRFRLRMSGRLGTARKETAGWESVTGLPG